MLHDFSLAAAAAAAFALYLSYAKRILSLGEMVGCAAPPSTFGEESV